LAFKQILIAASMAALLSACQSNRSTTQLLTSAQSQPTVTAEQLSSRERSELYQAILAAELAAGEGDVKSALTQYLFALSILPQKEIAVEAILLAQKSNDSVALVQAAKTWLKVEPTNRQAREAYILGNLMLFDQMQTLQEPALTDALVATKELIELYQDEKESYHALAALNNLYLNSSTLVLWQQLLREYPDNPLPWTLLGDAYLKASRISQDQSFPTKAEQAINVALQRNPKFAPAIDLKVEFLREDNQAEKVTPFLQSLLLDDLSNTAAHQALAEWFYQNREYTKALRATEYWQKHADNDSVDILYLQAASHYGLRDFKTAHEDFVKLLNTDYRPDLVRYYCGDTAERIEKFNQAKACYLNVGDSKYWYSSQQRLAQLMLNDDEQEQLLKRLTTYAFDGNAEQIEQSVVLKAQVLQELNRELEAVEWVARFINHERITVEVPIQHFKIIYKMNPENDWSAYAEMIGERLNPELVDAWYLQLANELSDRDQSQLAVALLTAQIERSADNLDLRYSRALMRERTNQPKIMLKELNALYQDDQDNPHIQNALGYTLADQNQQLDLALDLIQKAREQLPNSGAVLDSLGWVYYRLGKLQQAESALKVALTIESSAEVFAHYLEVLIENSKRDEAESMLLKAWDELKDNRYILRLVDKYKILVPQP